MNKQLFFVGLGIQIFQIIILGIFLLTQLDYSWLTADFITKAIGLSILVLLNIFSIILMLVGVFQNSEKEVK